MDASLMLDYIVEISSCCKWKILLRGKVQCMYDRDNVYIPLRNATLDDRPCEFVITWLAMWL